MIWHDGSGVLMLFIVALLAWFSSVGSVWKYSGTLGLLAYSVVVLTAPWWLSQLHPSRRTLLVLAGLVALVALLVMLFVYPRADVHVGDRGSDSDDALDLAARALLEGRYPYSQRTYLGNPIAQLPGAILLALPFVALGSAAYQALIWWPAFAVRLRSETSNLRSTGVAVALVLSSVAAWHALATGGDGLINGIYVALATLMVMRHPQAGWAVVWGVTLSSRAVFWPVVPLTLLVIADRDRAAAWRVGSVVGVTMAALIVPFWVWSPTRFSPLHTASKLTLLGTVSPWPGIVLFAVGFVLGVAWLRRGGAPEIRLFRSAVVAIGAPVVAMTLLFVALRGEQGLAYSAYGLEVLPFAAILAVASHEERGVAPSEVKNA